MNDFKKNGGFGGGDRRGGFGKRDFGGRPSFGGGRGFGREHELEMFSTICASCGKNCEVPFKPNGKKPVYCKECFAANGGPSADSRSSSDRFAPREDRRNDNSFVVRAPMSKPEYRPNGDNGMSEIKRQIDALNTKIDKIMDIVSGKASAPKAVAKPEVKPEAKAELKPEPKKAEAPIAKKSTAKKSPAKKK